MPRPRPASALAIALGLALSAPARADDALTLELEGGLALDGNPDRLTGAGSASAPFLLGLTRLRGRLEGEASRLDGQLTVAGKAYGAGGSGQASGATALGSRLELAGGVRLGPALGAGLALTASDLTERRGDLDQDALHAEATLGWTPGALRVSAALAWSAYAPRSALLSPFAASGPEAALRLAWRPGPAHLLSLAGTRWWARYPAWTPQQRNDVTQTVASEWAYAGDWLLGLGYAFSWNSSTVAGGAYQRHRLTARAAFDWGEFTVAARGALQLSHYPEPLYLEQQLLLAQENEDLLELRVTHPLGARTELALAWAYYRGESVAGAVAPDFGRSVLTLSVGWRGDLLGE